MVFFGKKSLFPVFGEKNNLFLILRKKNCLFHPQLPLYVMLKLKEKNCFRLVAKKIDCFSPQAKKKVCTEKKTIAPPRKSNGCCLRNITAFSLLKIFSLILVNLSVVVHPALLVLFLHRSIKTLCFDFHR